MTYDEVKYAKRQQASEAGRRARDRFADNGPQLEDGGRDIVVPSPVYNAELQFRMRCYGFIFYGGARKQWVRSTRRSQWGKVYAPAVWLRWARQVYRAAYPMWEGPR